MIKYLRLLSFFTLSACIAANASIEFADVTETTGLDDIGESFGASWGEFNGDGWPDIWLSAHGRPNKLWVNDTSGGFVLATDKIDPEWCGDAHGAAWADFDNDGDQDLIQITGAGTDPGFGGNCFYVNENGQLINRASDYGLDNPLARGRAPLWFDWNNDGFLDVLQASSNRPDGLASSTLFTQSGTGFIVDNVATGFSNEKENLYGQLIPVESDAMSLILHRQGPFPDRFYDIGSAPFQSIYEYFSSFTIGSVQDSAVGDFNGDLKADLFITRVTDVSATNQSGPRRVAAKLIPFMDEKGVSFRARGDVLLDVGPSWRNPDGIFIGSEGRNPASHLVKIRKDDDIGPVMEHVPGKSSGIYIGRVRSPNREQGDLWTVLASGAWQRVNLSVVAEQSVSDLNVIGFESSDGREPAVLLTQTQQGFIDSSATSGVTDPAPCRSVAAADFDNDMDLDLYLVCSHPVYNSPNRLLINGGRGQFSELEGAGGAAGSTRGIGDSVAVADYDRDGFVDLLVTNGWNGSPFNSDGPVQVFRNLGNENNWLEIDLQGTVSNRDGIGAIVTVVAGGVEQMRIEGGGIHQSSQNYTRLHFGLAGNKTAQNIQVRWPSGIVQDLQNIPAGTILTIVEPELRRSLKSKRVGSPGSPSAGDSSMVSKYVR